MFINVIGLFLLFYCCLFSFSILWLLHITAAVDKVWDFAIDGKNLATFHATSSKCISSLHTLLCNTHCFLYFCYGAQRLANATEPPCMFPNPCQQQHNGSPLSPSRQPEPPTVGRGGELGKSESGEGRRGNAGVTDRQKCPRGRRCSCCCSRESSSSFSSAALAGCLVSERRMGQATTIKHQRTIKKETITQTIQTIEVEEAIITRRAGEGRTRQKSKMKNRQFLLSSKVFLMKHQCNFKPNWYFHLKSLKNRTWVGGSVRENLAVGWEETPCFWNGDSSDDDTNLNENQYKYNPNHVRS